MKLWIKFLLITLVLGLPAFFLGPKIWTPTPDLKPTTTQIPFFLFLSLVESLTFGFGVAFIIYAWPLVQKTAPQAKKATTAAFIVLAWLLVSWWPHDNLHIHNGLDPWGLISIDYAFHLTLMISAFILSYYFFFILKNAGGKNITKQKQ